MTLPDWGLESDDEGGLTPVVEGPTEAGKWQPQSEQQQESVAGLLHPSSREEEEEDDDQDHDRDSIRVNTIRGRTPARVVLNFWLLGLLNNASYVIMTASAKSISNGSVALVYLAAVIPGSMTKASSPFWFDRASYGSRLMTATVLMSLAFTLAGPIGAGRLPIQLLGVACCSAQSALGEASLLALASRYPERGARAVAAWSSGTGFAGIFGYGWVLVLSALGMSEIGIQTSALATIPISFALAFYTLIHHAPPEPVILRDSSQALNEDLIHNQEDQGRAMPAQVQLSPMSRLYYALGLWPVTGAIFAVYFAEYAMQSGVWAAMGFPVDKRSKRDQFYEYANFAYQGGVLISRSSGFFFHGTIRKRALWIMALTQCGILIFFFFVAATHFWYDQSIYALCLIVGLFGGACYVHGFRILAASSKLDLRELSMSVGAFSADAGILLSNIMGLFIQACLYERNRLNAEFSLGGFCNHHSHQRRLF